MPRRLGPHADDEVTHHRRPVLELADDEHLDAMPAVRRAPRRTGRRRQGEAPGAAGLADLLGVHEDRADGVDHLALDRPGAVDDRPPERVLGSSKSIHHVVPSGRPNASYRTENVPSSVGDTVSAVRPGPLAHGADTVVSVWYVLVGPGRSWYGLSGQRRLRAMPSTIGQSTEARRGWAAFGADERSIDRISTARGFRDARRARSLTTGCACCVSSRVGGRALLTLPRTQSCDGSGGRDDAEQLHRS